MEKKTLGSFLSALRRAQGLIVTALGQKEVLCSIMLLDIEQHQIDQREEFFDPLVPNRAIGIYTYMYALLLQSLNEWNQSLRLNGRLATTESDTSALAEEWFFANRLLDDMFDVGLLRLTFEIYRIGVGAVKTTEVATLQEYH